MAFSCKASSSKITMSLPVMAIAFAFTNKEQLLIDYGRALARDAKHIPDELFDRLRSAFSEETIVVATAMGVFMIANNVFNDALQVEPEGKL